MDPGCLSRIPDTDFYPSRIPDTKATAKERGGKKFVVIPTFFCSHKFHIIENYFVFEMLKKKIWANFQRIIGFLTQKIVTKLSKIWVWDPGFRIQGSKKHRIPNPDPQHWYPGWKKSDPGWKKFGSGIRNTAQLLKLQFNRHTHEPQLCHFRLAQ